MNRPHIVWPIQLDTNGHILTAEQDSDLDISSCLAACLLWPLGTRDLDREFGITDPSFRDGGPDLDEIRQQLLLNEPRARTLLALDDPQLKDAIATLRLGFDQTTGRPA